MNTQFIIVHCSCPDPDTANYLSKKLVASKLAACVNISQQSNSVYSWQGNVENEPEYLLMIKSQLSLFSEIQELLVAEHPYECPEIIATPIINGFQGYLDWIAESTSYKS